MNTVTPKISTTYEVGAILVDSWGWEQTNIDFYVIVERKDRWLKVQKLNKLTSSEIGFMTKKTMPSLGISESSKPIRKKLKVFSGKESGFSFRDYMGGGWCDLWDGKPVTETHYA